MGDDAELGVPEHEREHGADTADGKSRDGDRMHVALVKHAEHDVHGQQRGRDEQRLAGERLLEGAGGTGKRTVNGCRHVDVLHGLVHRRVASLKDMSGCRLNESVVDANRPW